LREREDHVDGVEEGGFARDDIDRGCCLQRLLGGAISLVEDEGWARVFSLIREAAQTVDDCYPDIADEGQQSVTASFPCKVIEGLGHLA
jgi:hypothetical protein